MARALRGAELTARRVQSQGPLLHQLRHDLFHAFLLRLRQRKG